VSTQVSVDPDSPARDVARSDGVEGNARLTGMTGALLFAALAVEGVTILDLHDLLSVHVFVGMLVGALVVLKLASTGYRFARYYTGDPEYRSKGAPQVVLRMIGPVVVVTTIAVVVSGVVLVLAGESSRDPLLGIHKASFIVWFVVMTVHVVGHVRDTVQLSVADASSDREQRVAGRASRVALVLLATGAGLATGLVALDWVGVWRR
jgi:hypothetical protein